MGVQNRATYKAQKEVSFADNTNELIKALTMRISLEDLADSVAWLTENETISGEWTFAGSLIVSGDLVVSGSTLQIDSQIVTADAVIDMNDGEVGAGVTLGYSGLNIERGSADNYWFGFDEVRNAFTMGTITALSAPQIATTQVVVTRIDNPTNGYIPYWENSANRLNFDSFNNLLTANDVTGMSNISFALTDTIHLPTNPISTAFGAMKFTGGNLSIYDGGWQIVGTINASSSVLVSGTPTTGQIARWTGANTIEGVDDLTVPNDLNVGGHTTISRDNLVLLTLDRTSNANVEKLFTLGVSWSGTDYMWLGQGTANRSVQIFEGAGNGVLTINSFGLAVSTLGTGTVYSNGSYLTNINPSDKRLKENFQDLNYGLKEVLRLSHHWYNYIGEGTLKLGWLAQEVRTIMPELVASYKGQSKKYLGLNTEAMPALNQRAIQEFYSEYQKQIQLLKSEIQSLKTQQS